MESSRDWPWWARRASTSAALIVVAAATVVLYRYDPARVRFYPVCVFHALTGLQCPGCGGTRAIHHLLHGDVAGAFRLNPLLFAVAPFTAVSLRWPRVAAHPAAGWIAAVVIVAFWIGRNL